MVILLFETFLFIMPSRKLIPASTENADEASPIIPNKGAKANGENNKSYFPVFPGCGFNESFAISPDFLPANPGLKFLNVLDDIVMWPDESFSIKDLIEK